MTIHKLNLLTKCENLVFRFYCSKYLYEHRFAENNVDHSYFYQYLSIAYIKKGKEEYSLMILDVDFDKILNFLNKIEKGNQLYQLFDIWQCFKKFYLNLNMIHYALRDWDFMHFIMILTKYQF